MKNVIILGPGRTGSSFLAGLIAHNRYYVNLEKIQTRRFYPDGAYENPELVELNKKLFHLVGYEFDCVRTLCGPDIQQLEQLIKRAKYEDIMLFNNFITKCHKRGPWLWKDPRLCYTIYFWKNLLDLNDIKFILITREPYQVFRSHSKSRIKFTKNQIYERYKAQIIKVEEFFYQNDISALKIDCNDFKVKDKLIEKLNTFLEINITANDFYTIKKPINKNKESDFHFWIRYYLGAAKIYLDRLMAFIY